MCSRCLNSSLQTTCAPGAVTRLLLLAVILSSVPSLAAATLLSFPVIILLITAHTFTCIQHTTALLATRHPRHPRASDPPPPTAFPSKTSLSFPPRCTFFRPSSPLTTLHSPLQHQQDGSRPTTSPALGSKSNPRPTPRRLGNARGRGSTSPDPACRRCRRPARPGRVEDPRGRRRRRVGRGPRYGVSRPQSEYLLFIARRGLARLGWRWSGLGGWHWLCCEGGTSGLGGRPSCSARSKACPFNCTRRPPRPCSQRRARAFCRDPALGTRPPIGPRTLGTLSRAAFTVLLVPLWGLSLLAHGRGGVISLLM